MGIRIDSTNEEYGEVVGPAVRLSISDVAERGRNGTAAEIAEEQRRHAAFMANLPGQK